MPQNFSFNAIANAVQPEDRHVPFFADPKQRNRSRYIQLKQLDKYPEQILIHKAPYVITADTRDRVVFLKDASILIRRGIIEEVFLPGRRKVDLNKLDLVYDASQRGGTVITPGLVNAHAHPPMYLLRATLLENRQQQLEAALRNMAKLEQQMSQEDFFLGALGDFTEEQKMGITTTLSHYGVFEPIESAAALCRQRVINAVSAVSNSHPENTPAFVEKYLRRAKQYSTKPAIALHYVYRTTPAILKQIARLQKKYRATLTLHCAESEHVVAETLKKFGLTEVQTLHKFGLLGPRTILSHCVYVSDADIALLKKTRTGIVHLPTSNKIHKNDEFRYPEFYRQNNTHHLSLGTDSVVSKNALDLVSEALQTRLIHQGKRIVSFDKLFRMMTSQGAQVLGLKSTGKIAPGYRADLAFWKLRDRGFIPFNKNNPSSLLANFITFGGRNVRDLMISGHFVISNRLHNLVHETNLLTQIQLHHERLQTQTA